MNLPKARAAAAITAVAAAILSPVVVAAPAAAAVTQASFTADGGATQHFVVPAAVTRLFVSAIGGSGGAGASRVGFSGGSGGAAGSVTASLAVTPGQTLNITSATPACPRRAVSRERPAPAAALS